MALHPRAGLPATALDLCSIPLLISSYFQLSPTPDHVEQQVSFGTSGHRGSSLNKSFNETHILAITQAIADYRSGKGSPTDNLPLVNDPLNNGPLFIGKDTHALSEPAFTTVVQVLVANGITVHYQKNGGFTPTPVISQAILSYNQDRTSQLADGIIITPSHNPPQDGGIKYNASHGGPAEAEATDWIQARANEHIANQLKDVKRLPVEQALASELAIAIDYVTPYVEALDSVIDMAAISKAKIRIGVDPMGGSGIDYWPAIAARYNLDITVVNDVVDPQFAFMTLDKDGKIRMDCSSPWAMASLIKQKDQFDVAVSNDPDNDRHGIVVPSVGLMNPNHYLSVCVSYLLSNRPQWKDSLEIGKTLVSSSMIDRVVAGQKATLNEVPVGFKWFVDDLFNSTLAFGGEESAGASFLCKNGKVWSTDKDGIILALLAAEIIATTQKDPGQHYQALEKQYGSPVYERLDAPATREQKAILKNLNANLITADSLAGDIITHKLTEAPGNHAAIGGLKVVTDNGWFAARPSGTEDIYKIYAESFVGKDHLKQIQTEAQAIVSKAFNHA